MNNGKAGKRMSKNAIKQPALTKSACADSLARPLRSHQKINVNSHVLCAGGGGEVVKEEEEGWWW